jgi:hypothetical protein
MIDSIKCSKKKSESKCEDISFHLTVILKIKGTNEKNKYGRRIKKCF